jgi:hypothetical protein
MDLGKIHLLATGLLGTVHMMVAFGALMTDPNPIHTAGDLGIFAGRRAIFPASSTKARAI